MVTYNKKKTKKNIKYYPITPNFKAKKAIFLTHGEKGNMYWYFIYYPQRLKPEIDPIKNLSMAVGKPYCAMK